jgi:hypothetical protein
LRSRNRFVSVRQSLAPRHTSSRRRRGLLPPLNHSERPWPDQNISI